MNINITQILRPIRLAFFIKPNNSKSYLRAVRICSALWGGKYFPILPVYKKFTRDFRIEYNLYNKPVEFYSNSIENFDPDYIVVDENMDKNYVELFIGDRTIISLKELEESVLSGESEYGISIDDILYALKDTEFKFDRTDSLNIILPKVEVDDLFSATIFGTISEQNIKKLETIPLSPKYISFPTISQNDYSDLNTKNSLDYFGVCNQSVYPVGNPFWSSQTAIYIVNPDRLNDLISFWNLRALGWNIIAIPYNKFEDDYFKSQIEQQRKEFINQGSITNHINILAGAEIEEKVIHNIQKYLNPSRSNSKDNISYSFHWWIPRFWNDRKHLDYDKSASVLIRSKVEKHIMNLNESIRIPVIIPEFGNKYIKHVSPRFVNEISYEFDDFEAKYAQIIPSISSSKLDIIIKGVGFNQWRFSQNGTFFLSTAKDEFLSFSIPEARSIFEKWFLERGYKIKMSSAGKLIDQLFRNIGGIYGTNFFATPGILPVLALFENGKIVKQQTLFGQLSKQKKQGHFRFHEINDVVYKLIEKNIIQFGAELQCTLCQQRTFYTLAEFKDVVKCSVCHNQFKTPSHNPKDIIWSYRGIGTFSRNNKSEGIISVLLTLRFFRIGLHSESLTPLLNFEILKEDEVINEVDFAVFYKKFKNSFTTPDLFFCECKTEIDFAKKDVDRMESLAKMFPSSILVFATLKDRLSGNEKTLISSLAKKFRKGLGSRPINPVLILTQNELMSSIIYDKEIKYLENSRLKFSDEIGHLCDITVQHYLGLPSFTSEVEARFRELEEKRKHKEENSKEK